MAQEQKFARVPAQKGNAVLDGIALSLLCVVSYWLITHLLVHAFPVSREDDLLGGMWAVVATVFVYPYSYEQSTGAGLSRMTATSLSFAFALSTCSFFRPKSGEWPRSLGLGRSRCPFSTGRRT